MVWWNSLQLYVRLIGTGWWVVGIGVFATVIGVFLDVTQVQNFPSWPWILAFILTAVIAPFFAFRQLHRVIEQTILHAPRLRLLPRLGSLVVTNQGGRADVAVDCILKQEFVGSGEMGPVPLLWQKTNTYRMNLLQGESAILFCIETTQETDDISAVVVRIHNPSGENTRVFHRFNKGFNGRVGYIVAVLNTAPIWIGHDPTEQFNIVVRSDGIAVLESRHPNQEILDLLENRHATG